MKCIQWWPCVVYDVNSTWNLGVPCWEKGKKSLIIAIVYFQLWWSSLSRGNCMFPYMIVFWIVFGIPIPMGFPGGSNGSICLQCGRPGFDPWVRKIPWSRKWWLTPVLSGEFCGQGSLWVFHTVKLLAAPGLLCSMQAFSSCGAWALECEGSVVALWRVRSYLPDQGLNLHPLYCRADSWPPDHKGSSPFVF